nr:immunoglobulin-like domain-containing protein [Sporolactobacillus kofuensis]
MGPSYKALDYGSPFNALDGIQAQDPKDGDLTSAMKVSGDNINTKKPGIYRVNYSVSNAAGVTALHKLTVLVKQRDKK